MPRDVTDDPRHGYWSGGAGAEVQRLKQRLADAEAEIAELVRELGIARRGPVQKGQVRHG